MKEIPLTQGKVALVDDEDYELVNSLKWYAHLQSGTFYAMRHTPRTDTETRKLIGMHKFIIKTPDEFETDHIDGDGLNNQKSNLRVVTTRENQQNQHKEKTSKYPGVSWKKSNNMWCAQIQVNKKVIGLGLFKTELEAHERYMSQVDRVNKGLGLTPNASTKTSKYRGVYWSNTNKKWRVTISIKRKPKYLGMFDSEEDAHEKYERVRKVIEDWCVIDV